jgi:hypothetical protein
MKPTLRSSLIALSLCAASAHAASILASGADTSTTNDAWRTSGVAKPLDADGNNVYGSDGYLMFNTGYTGSTFTSSTNVLANASSALPAYVAVIADGATGSVGAAAFAQIDDPLNPVNDFRSGVATASYNFANLGAGVELSMFNLTFTNAPVGGVRVGVLVNNAANRNAEAIRFELDGSSGAVTASQSTGQNVNVQQDYYFFDITGIANGDTFSFFATEDTADGNNTGEIRVGGFTFDAIPEPSSTTLLGIALGAMLLRRQRRD